MNQGNFIGRLGADVKVNTVSGKQVGNFSVAVDMGYGDKKSTLWLNCALWDKDKLYQYLVKGTQVYVSGEVSLRTWEKDGKHGASMELRVFQVQLLGSKADGAADSPEPAKQTAPVTAQDEDLPF